MSDNTNDVFSDRLKTVVSYSERLPIEQKLSKNKAWAKRRINAIDLSLSDTPGEEYVNGVEDSYRLMCGLPMKNYTATAKASAQVTDADLLSEGISTPDLHLEVNYDVVSPLLDIIHGDAHRSRLTYVVSDSSIATKNFYKEARAQELKDHIMEKIIMPTRQLAMIEWAAQNGVTDMFQLPPDAREQAMAQIEDIANKGIPEQIARFVKKGRKAPLEIQGQALADALVQYLGIKSLRTEAYMHSFATDAAIFAYDIVRNRPTVRLVDATHFTTRGSNNRFIDGNAEFKEVEYLHPSDVWTRYGDQFSREDMRTFDELVSGGGPSHSEQDERIATRIDFSGELMLSQIDMKTQEGQMKHGAFLAKYANGEEYRTFEKMRVVHITWLSLAKMKLITKGYGDGTVREEWYTEDYRFNPENGDLEETVHWVPQYWRGTKIGRLGATENGNAIFVNLGPVPFQRRDITDPYNVHSPYVGGYLSNLRGKAEINSTLNRIKPWVRAFDFHMKMIRDREATDIGKVVLMTVAAKPKNWSWGKFIEVVRATKMLPINTQQAGLTAMDVQFFREIDLSNMYDILPRLNNLNFIISQIASIVGVNNARRGEQAASTSVTNNMSNLQRSYSQTHARGAWIDDIIGNLINHLVYAGRMTAKNGNIFMRYALDDLSMAHIDIDVDDVESPLFHTKVLTDADKLEERDIAKNLLMPYIQNQGLAYHYALRSLLAATKGELLDIADEAELEASIQSQQAEQARAAQAQQMIEMQFNMEKAMLELKNGLDMVRDEQNNAAKRDMAALQSMTLANANDVDRDGNNDYLESAQQDRAVKTLDIMVKDQLERDKLALEQWNKKADLHAQLEKIDVMRKQAEASKMQAEAKKIAAKKTPRAPRTK